MNVNGRGAVNGYRNCGPYGLANLGSEPHYKSGIRPVIEVEL